MLNRTDNLNIILRGLMADCRQESLALPPSIAEKQRLMRALMNVREPLPASDALLEAQDAELRQQREEKKGASPPFPASPLTPLQRARGTFRERGEITTADGERWLTFSLPSPLGEGSGVRLFLWKGDITRLQVDAIVNAANAQGLGCWVPLHMCIDNCIHSAAGIQLRQECNDILRGRLLGTGEAMITKGYNLPAKYVIHTVGPIIETGIPSEEQEEQLAQCYRSCLDLAEENRLESIAFCCISTGVFRFPAERAAEIAIKTVKEYPLKTVKSVVFNVFSDRDYDIYIEKLKVKS